MNTVSYTFRKSKNIYRSTFTNKDDVHHVRSQIHQSQNDTAIFSQALTTKVT